MKVEAHGIDVPTDHELPQMVRRRHVQVLGSEPENVGFQDPGSYAWTDAGWFMRGGTIPIIYGPSANQQRAVPIELGKFVRCSQYCQPLNIFPTYRDTEESGGL